MRHSNQFLYLFVSICSLLWLSCTQKEVPKATSIQTWLTTADKSSLFKLQDRTIAFSLDSSALPTIVVDTTQRLQEVDGFGFSLTGGSAQLINSLSAANQDSLLRELFLTDDSGIGISFLRISIGASDLDDHVFSYDDLPSGSTDVNLEKFTMVEDQKNLIPVLKKIVALNPDIKVMGSPWSAPAWMKSNGSPKGGLLKQEFYPAYANYFVKYLQAMEKEGIKLHSITIQNEPENPKNNPSMVMTAVEQAVFIRDHLGPAFKTAGLTTKIILFDHNCDNPDYPITVLNDTNARQYVDGSAFHMYLGEITAMSKVHDAHPDKNLYFTEQWTSGDGDFGGDLKWHVENLIVGAMRNWSRTVLEWNLAADPKFNPHTTDGGCDRCLGALTISDQVSRNVSYYIIAHASKFVRPGSVRVGSNLVDGLPNVAFINPAGEKVLIVLNTKDQSQSFQIRLGGQTASSSLGPGAVATFVWK
jgi:glucosylceramidase